MPSGDAIFQTMTERLIDIVRELNDNVEASGGAIQAMATSMNDIVSELKEIRDEVELLRAAIEQANVANGGRGV